MQRLKHHRILMLLENESFPDDTRVLLEATALVDAGFAVTVVCPTGKRTGKSETIEDVRVYRYPKPWAMTGLIGYVAEYAYSMLMGFLYAWFVLLRHGFDTIHIHAPPDMNALVAIAFKLLGKHYVLDMHDLSPELYQAQRDGNGSRVVERALRWFERLACRQADRLIATNETQRRVQVQRCGVRDEHCYVVRNGPNEMFLRDVEPREELCRAGRMVIGYVGMIGTQDGVDYFVRMIDELRSRRSDFIGVIVGDGPALPALEQMVAELKLQSCVQFTGLVEFADVPRYIASFDVCVTPDPCNPYNDSCTTIKTMEYMALGKPTVAFATSENRITAGDAALYASDNDPIELAALVEQLLNDSERRTRMGEAGRTRIERSLSWAHQQKQLVALYNDLLHDRDHVIADVPVHEA